MIHYVRKSSCRKTSSHVYVTGLRKRYRMGQFSARNRAIDTTFNFLNSYYLRIFDKYSKKKYSFDLRKIHIFLCILSEMKDLKCIKYIEMRKPPFQRNYLFSKRERERITKIFTKSFIFKSSNMRISRYVYYTDHLIN